MKSTLKTLTLLTATALLAPVFAQTPTADASASGAKTREQVKNETKAARAQGAEVPATNAYGVGDSSSKVRRKPSKAKGAASTAGAASKAL